ncbi:GFA family protein [Novosphingobium sp.]|uniref:GFA family protein n=1 Tax=Novosphingobium sp. TaxID=1874826 RepID=UPI0026069165|nr:GFA family protein [Novosphingobium sp.]
MAYTGSCACGAVTATITAEAPIAVRQCWCRQCQQLAGGSHSTNAMFLTEDVTITGPLGTHAYTAASGNTLTQSFCGHCGTPVMGQVSARPQFRTLRVGFITPPHDLVPQMAIWTDDAPAWAVIPEHLERHGRQPPPPPTKA